jgi:RNA polymerase sigma factor (sigma-70 family)
VSRRHGRVSDRGFRSWAGYFKISHQRQSLAPPRPYTSLMAQLAMASSGLGDEGLLAGVAQGDDAAMAAFVRRYQKRVFGLAYSMLGDTGAAEEVAQETFIRVWRHALVFDARRGSVTTWVLTIARNLSIDALRMRRAIAIDPAEFLSMGLLSNEGLPEESALAGESVPALRKALASLPGEQQRALVLAAVYGRTASEISDLEAIPLGTAKTRIRAGMSKLRTAMTSPAISEKEQR